MHDAAYEWVAAHATTGRVLEVGSRVINGTVRPLFSGSDYCGIDINEGEGVDLVVDVTTYKPRTKYDVIVCCEVLEHADNPAEIVTAAGGLLKKGGKLILTAAGPGRPEHSAVDGAALRPGEWYRNIERADLEQMLKGWADVTIDVSGNDIRAVAFR